jgi:hypothetical protein
MRCNMRINTTALPWRTTLAWSAAFLAAGLSTFGFIGGLWLSAAGDSAGRAASLVAVSALAALAGMAWCASRARADQRWRAALDRYAERQLAEALTRREFEKRPAGQ